MKKFLFSLFSFLCLFFFLVGTVDSAEDMPNETHNLCPHRERHYDFNNRISAIENYNITEGGNKQLICTERLNWHPTLDQKLHSHTMEDCSGRTLLNQTFKYDELGRLVEKIEWKIEDELTYSHYTYYYNENGERLKRSVVAQNLELLESCDCIEKFFGDADEKILSEEFATEPFNEADANDLESSPSPFEDSIETGFYGHKRISNVRITYVNGILNSKDDFVRSLKLISETHGNVRVHFAFKETRGWTWDLLQCSIAKLGYVCPHAQALAELWKSLIAEMGGPDNGGIIIHYAHSIGGTHSLSAKYLLTPEEQQMIQIYTFGSPTMIPNEGYLSVVNYVSVHDWISFLDPISHIQSFFSPADHIVCINNGNFYYIPFSDHLLEGDTYKVVMVDLGDQFKKTYCLGE